MSELFDWLKERAEQRPAQQPIIITVQWRPEEPDILPDGLPNPFYIPPQEFMGRVLHILGLPDVPDPLPIYKVKVTASPFVNIRFGAEIHSRDIGDAKLGSVLTVIGEPVNGFLKLHEQEGYVSTQWVQRI
jgi:hypothetical protein